METPGLGFFLFVLFTRADDERNSKDINVIVYLFLRFHLHSGHDSEMKVSDL